MNTYQIIILTILLLLCLISLIAVIKIYSKKNPESDDVVVSPEKKVSAEKPKATSSHRINTNINSKIFGFFKAIVGLVFVAILIMVIIYGILELVQDLKNSTVKASCSNDNELVIIRPGESIVVDLENKNTWSFNPPHPTMVEQFNSNRELIPIRLNGRMVNMYIDSPGDNNTTESFSDDVRFLRLRSANENVGEYSFLIHKE
jgi:hypothetical protein